MTNGIKCVIIITERKKEVHKMKFSKKTKTTKSNNKWWIIKTKKYTIPLYLLPIALVIIPFYKISELCDKHFNQWDEKRADKVLSKWLDKVLEWDEEEQEFSRYINRVGNWYMYKSMPFGHRKWAWKHHHTLKEYLLEVYENVDYEKIIEEEYDWYEIIFREKA